MKVLVIGGGAAGFFAAINIAEKHPESQVTILEKSGKLLSKVKVSGGGRCNVTNARSKPAELVPFYPRGQKKLYPVFQSFSTDDMVSWLEQRGVPTHTEPDLRMFPTTNSSQTIIDCFLKAAQQLNIQIIQNCAVTDLVPTDPGWEVVTNTQTYNADKVVMATGSSPAAWKLLSKLGLHLEPPVPSLFTFNIKDSRIEGLMGLSFPEVKLKISSSKLEASGPMLITHWGLSGPAVLKLSAWGARHLAGVNYEFRVLINYLGDWRFESTLQQLNQEKSLNGSRKVRNYPLGDLPKRFWERMCAYCEIADTTIYAELSKKQINKLTEELTQGLYRVNGKSTFKEEFVTSGGVKLTEVDLSTFEARRFPGLYLAGEVLDIDALTGGFNFQACWSGAWIISEHIHE